jgi:hypothetical protein
MLYKLSCTSAPVRGRSRLRIYKLKDGKRQKENKKTGVATFLKDSHSGSNCKQINLKDFFLSI